MAAGPLRVRLPGLNCTEDASCTVVERAESRLARAFRELQEAQSALTRVRGALLELQGLDKDSMGELVVLAKDAPMPYPGLKTQNSSVSNEEPKANRLPDPAMPLSVVPPAPLSIIDMSANTGADSPSGASAAAFKKKGRPMNTFWMARSASSEDLGSREAHPSMPVVDQVVISSIGRSTARFYGKSLLKDQAEPTESERKKTQTQPSMEQQSIALTSDVTWHRVCWGWIQMPTFHPESQFRIAWLLFGLVAIGYEAVAIPVYLAFSMPPTGEGMFVWVSILNTYFIADIFIHFFSAYMDGQGNIVTAPGKIARQYLGTWLLPDLVASIPWEWIRITEAQNEVLTKNVRIIRGFRMVTMLRMLRLFKVGAFMNRIEYRLESDHVFWFIFGVIRAAGFLVVICHWCACTWYGIGSAYYSEVGHMEDGMELPLSWVKYYQDNYPFIGMDKWRHYVYSMYFCLTTMSTVGYGDISPKNYAEVRFAMVLLILSSICFANLMGTLTNMLATLNHRRRILVEKKVTLSRYLRFRAVPWKLTVSVRQHLLFLWDTYEGYDTYEDELKGLLTPVLKQELCHHIYGRLLTSAPFLAWMRDFPICTKTLAEKVESVFLTPDDLIFRMGQANEEIHMLLTGNVWASRIEHLSEMDTLDKGASDVSMAMVSKMIKRVLKKDEQTRKTRYKSFRTSDIDPESPDVLHMAMLELRLTDIRQKVAARAVQRLWRQRIDRSKSPRRSQQKTIEQWLKTERMHRRQVGAPAYFGEACLWQPLQEWGRVDPPPYRYSVRCQTRGELARIPRNAIKEVLDRFTPWIPERLEIFQAAIRKQFDGMTDDSIFRILVTDWCES